MECLAAGWKPAVVEYPVELNGVSTHIDFVLASGSHLIVVECKRVDGWTWGFARSFSQIVQPRADRLQWNDGKLFRRACTIRGWKESSFDTAVEMKQHGGDATPRTLDSAVAQVFRGRGGLMEDFAGRKQFRYAGGAVVPVILTTASLVTTDTALADAELQTGELLSVQATAKNFLAGSLRPRVPREDRPNSPPPTKSEALQTSLAHDMARSVAIVHPTGIKYFLENLRNLVEHGTPIDD